MSLNPNLNRMLRQALYQLKRQYGASVDVYQWDTASTDYRTGEKTGTPIKSSVRHAVVMPAETVRKFFQGVSYLGAGRDFASQGSEGWDQDTRGFIFDGRDLPAQNWNVEDWIVYGGNRYEVSLIQSLEFEAGWLIMGKRVRGSNPEQQIDLNVVHSINANDTAETS